jgi:copper chaperone CopZ
MSSEVKLEVKGMSCGHCQARVKKALEEVQGVGSAEVDLGSGLARIKGIDLDPALLAKAVEEAGYQASQA